MVELPGAALRCEHALVYFSYLVALLALVEFRSELPGCMASLARDQFVHARNREVGEIVIKAGGSPARANRMTIGAGVAQVALVNVITFVTIHAGRARVPGIDFFPRRVTGDTGNFFVATMERIGRQPVVIE